MTNNDMKMKKNQLKTFFGEIEWHCKPWESVKVTNRNGFRVISGKSAEAELDKADSQDPTENPANDFTMRPLLWREVSKNWFFAFKDNEIDKVKGYYGLYGPLCVVPRFFRRQAEEKCGYVHNGDESWELNQLALGWFNCLTSMLDWIKNSNIGVIKDLAANSLPDDSVVQIYPDDFGPNKETPIPFYDAHWLITMPVFSEWHVHQDDSSLLQAVWQSLVEHVNTLLNEIKIKPAAVGDYKVASHSWRFKASGAFEAAFLQWYFSEVINFKAKECKKDGCNNLVIPRTRKGGSRKEYCSTECRDFVATREYRERQRKAIEFSSKGYSHEDIVSQVFKKNDPRKLELKLEMVNRWINKGKVI